MGISAVFQLFFFRQPARHRLRLQLADTMFRLSAYNSLLQAFVNLVAPADEAPTPKPEALAKVHRELVKREIRIQADILALAPTFQFAKIEPKFQAPFKADCEFSSMQARLSGSTTDTFFCSSPEDHAQSADHPRPAPRSEDGRWSARLQRDDPPRFRQCPLPLPVAFAAALPHAVLPQRYIPHVQDPASTRRSVFEADMELVRTRCAGPFSTVEQSATRRGGAETAWLLAILVRFPNLPPLDVLDTHPLHVLDRFYLVSLGSVSNELEEMEKYLGDVCITCLVPASPQQRLTATVYTQLFGDPDESNPYIS
jgi:hypothetical protein